VTDRFGNSGGAHETTRFLMDVMSRWVQKIFFPQIVRIYANQNCSYLRKHTYRQEDLRDQREIGTFQN